MSKNNKSEIVIGNNTYYRINDDTFINVSEIKKIKIDNKDDCVKFGINGNYNFSNMINDTIIFGARDKMPTIQSMKICKNDIKKLSKSN